MVAGKYRSRSKRKIFVKVPGNTVKTHYRLRKPNCAVCAVYGTPLSGVPREVPSKMRNLPKCSKRPERPFGGVLSSRAMRDAMKNRARSLNFAN